MYDDVNDDYDDGVNDDYDDGGPDFASGVIILCVPSLIALSHPLT